MSDKTKTILTVECLKMLPQDEIDTDNLERNTIEVDGWLYELAPMRGSIVESEIDATSTDDTIALMYGDNDEFHASMQYYIARNMHAWSRCTNQYVIHLLLSEYAYKEPDNWTGPGDYCVEIEVLGVVDFNSIATVKAGAA